MERNKRNERQFEKRFDASTRQRPCPFAADFFREREICAVDGVNAAKVGEVVKVGDEWLIMLDVNRLD